MKKRMLIGLTAVVTLTLIIMTPVVVSTNGFDTSEADGCGSCHSSELGELTLSTVVAQWYTSEHASGAYQYGVNDNTYCARCHSPLQADVVAVRTDPSTWKTIAPEDWQAVTCSACHLPRALAHELGTRIGNYDVSTGEYIPRYEDVPGDMDAQCTWCHSTQYPNRHYGLDFMSFGKTMYEKKDVLCVDCHMSDQYAGTLTDGTVVDIHSHTWRVRESAPTACIVCHENKTLEWAEKQIDKGKMHRQKHD